MILTGWKQISKHLGYGIRTVQRWERKGLPVKRVTGGPRSPVVANSEDLDGWMLRGKTLPPGAPPDLLQNLQRARELQRQVEHTRNQLRLRLEALKKQIAERRARQKK